MINKLIVYQPDEFSTTIEVRVEDETVWLNRHQISTLFERDVKTIGKHISNALKEELRNFQVVAKFATTASDGKTYQMEYYNLDMILSIGYRVKSARGIQFRIWANKILKEYMLKGYSVNHRIDCLEGDVNAIKKKLGEIDFQIHTSLPRNEEIFFEGQVFDAFVFVSELIKSAKTAIVLIDNYIDESVLFLLSKRTASVSATIYTKTISKQLELDLKKHNQQYPEITIKTFSKAHDRFLVIDQKTIYHFGASLKDLGKKWFAFSKMEIEAMSLLNRIIEE